jgi:TonB family protein
MTALADVLGPAVYNLLAWTAQAAVLAIAAMVIGKLLPHPRGRLLFLQMVLVAALLLPAVEPWAQPATRSSDGVSISTGPANIYDPSPARFHLQWKPEYLLWIVAIVAGARLLWIMVGLARLRSHRKAAQRLEHPPVPFARGNVTWYVSETVLSPVTFGSSILLPARVAALPDDLKEAIACHELIHVERRDWLFVLAEEILRALLWFQPAIWILLAEIQLAREQVVDGEVIALLHDRECYLDALVAVAAHKFQPDLAPAPLFLKKRHLAARVATLLKETRMSKARLFLSFTGACSAVVAAALVTITFFPLQSTAQEPARAFAVAADGPGITVDAGAPLMHRTGVFRPSGVTATGTVVVEATLDSKGEVSDARVLSGPDELRRAALQSVLQWHYASEPSPPASVRATITFGAAPAASATVPNVPKQIAPISPAPAMLTLTSIEIAGVSPELAQKLRQSLPVHEGDQMNRMNMPQILAAARQIDEHFTGGLSVSRNNEATLHLTLASPPPLPVAQQSAPMSPSQRIRVGGNVQQANLLQRVNPAYPVDAKEARVQGIVHLAVVIGKDGTVTSIELLSGHPLLAPAALDAVKQWVYKPTLLNGNPVEVITQVDVNFTLSQ